MKLFVNQNKHEGEAYARNAFISFGKKLDARKGGFIVNGFYIKIEFPFPRKYAQYINPNTFEPEMGHLRKVFMVGSRKRQGEGKTYWTFISAWWPVSV
jgi:hypothetical protein